MKPEIVWRRESVFYVVEGRVGNTWVEMERVSAGWEEALSAARKHLEALVEVRLCEHVVKHTNSIIYQEKAAPILRLPPKLTPTGENGICRVCKGSTVLSTDGTTRWALCTKCSRMLPG